MASSSLFYHSQIMIKYLKNCETTKIYYLLKQGNIRNNEIQVVGSQLPFSASFYLSPSRTDTLYIINIVKNQGIWHFR